MNAIQKFKASYRGARLARKHECEFMASYWLGHACLNMRETYKHIDLHERSLVGKFKRHVIQTKWEFKKA